MEAAVEAAFAGERAQVLATVIRLSGDWDLAEECVQEAFERALRRWPDDGVPARPGAWLTVTARRVALDRLRRGVTEAQKMRLLTSTTQDAHHDDRLRLLFTCCHPALPFESRVALTLRTVAGLEVEQIAAAFLITPATATRRITRAKQKIRNAGIPYRVPAPEMLHERLTGVLAVVYLIFNQGYSGHSGPELLAGEAIRLGRLLAHLMPTETEVRGLLALMVLHQSRSAARHDAGGTLITLDQQDRDRWDQELISEGLSLLSGTRTPYQLQAAIAACHARAPRAPDTDWQRIVQLYAALHQITRSPVVELNRVVAVSMAHGPALALPLLDGLESDLGGYYLLPATRADLLRRLDRRAEAAQHYRRALDLAPTPAEKAFLTGRLEESGIVGE
ncbi:RNA polymerase subunit sigma-24 [Kineosporia sp. NBRC 101731]|nr:RNA polymerase subunit sigma-24 [Kineosporia sp. NBRC 101731]